MPAAPPDTADHRAKLRRNRELALIHAAKKALDLDDATYRAVLMNLTRKDSAAKLGPAQRLKVIEYFRARGFRPLPARRLGGEVAKQVAALKDRGAKPQEAMIEALWDELRRLGAFRDGLARLDTWLHRQGCHVSHPRFLTPDQASLVIEALKAWRRRVKRQRGIE